VFRSNSLHAFTPSDLVAFDALGISTIFDLRSDEEREQEPGPRACVPITLPIPIAGETDWSAVLGRRAGEEWLLEDYCSMVANAGPAFGRLFSQLADGGLPSVFHCGGGKDRTGLTAALLLTSLGVDRDIVLDDYELTTAYSPPGQVAAMVDLFAGYGVARSTAEGLLGTPRWVMAEVLARLDDSYGGIDSYLRGPASIDGRAVGTLRARLVV